MSALGPYWTVPPGSAPTLPNGAQVRNCTPYSVIVLWWTDGAVSPLDGCLSIVDGKIVELQRWPHRWCEPPAYAQSESES